MPPIFSHVVVGRADHTWSPHVATQRRYENICKFEMWSRTARTRAHREVDIYGRLRDHHLVTLSCEAVLHLGKQRSVGWLPVADRHLITQLVGKQILHHTMLNRTTTTSHHTIAGSGQFCQVLAPIRKGIPKSLWISEDTCQDATSTAEGVVRAREVRRLE